MFVILLQLLSIALLLSLGVVAWLQQRGDRVRRNLLLFTSLFSLWLVLGIISNLTSPFTLVINRLVFVAALFLTWSSYALVLSLVKHHSKLAHYIFIYVVMSSVAVVGTGLVVNGVVSGDVGGISGYNIQRGPLYIVYVLSAVSIASCSLWRIYISIKSARRRVRSQLLVVSMGLAASLAWAVLTAVIIPSLTQSSVASQFSFVSGILVATAFTYAVIKHGLFDIRMAVVRTVAYGLSLISMALAYFLLVYVISTVVFAGNVTTGISTSPINLVIAFMIALIFHPSKQFFDRVTNKIFFRDQYDSNTFIVQLGHTLAATTDLHDLLDVTSLEIVTTLKASGGVFIVYLDDGPNEVVIQGDGKELSEDAQEELKILIEDTGRRVATIEQMHLIAKRKNLKVVRLLQRQHVDVMLPLVRNGKCVGALLLGEQKATFGYAKRDAMTLESIADELIIAIQNARSIKEVQMLNTNLKSGILSATRKLRASNNRLLEMDATKDEFVSMASHQLRTPLTSVKGYISMVLEGDAGPVNRSQEQLLGEAFASSERMVHLIGDFLNVSRLQTGKFMVDRRKCDLAKIVTEEIEGIRQIAFSHQIDIVYHRPARFPVLYIDEGKIRQVIMNFIDNAIYYSPAGSKIKIHLHVEDGYAVLVVYDTGIGVPKAEQSHLFTKFFRASNARKQRPDGTGIGLYLAKKIVDVHGGRIIFESVQDQGSTFGFRLPVKKLSLAPVEDTPKFVDDHAKSQGNA